MSRGNAARSEASSGSKTEVVDNFKRVRDRLETLVLKLNNLSNDENPQKDKKASASTNKRESFFRELNQMRNEVITNVNDIQRQILSLRPTNTNDADYVNKAQSYLILIHLTKDILEKLNHLYSEVFDRFSEYIDQLWNFMIKHDQAQVRRLTREFNEYFQEKTSNSNKLVNDVQQLLNDIENTEEICTSL